MVRERKSTRELRMSLADFKRFGFNRGCKLASVAIPPRPKPKPQPEGGRTYA